MKKHHNENLDFIKISKNKVFGDAEFLDNRPRLHTVKCISLSSKLFVINKTPRVLELMFIHKNRKFHDQKIHNRLSMYESLFCNKIDVQEQSS